MIKKICFIAMISVYSIYASDLTMRAQSGALEVTVNKVVVKLAKGESRPIDCQQSIGVKEGTGTLVLYKASKAVKKLQKGDSAYKFNAKVCQSTWESLMAFLGISRSINTDTRYHQGVGRKGTATESMIVQDILFDKTDTKIALYSKPGTWFGFDYRLDVYSGDKVIYSALFGTKEYIKSRDYSYFVIEANILKKADHYTITGNVGVSGSTEKIAQKGSIRYTE